MSKPIRWSVNRGRALWYSGMPIAEMASRLATSPGAIKEAARRNGWEPRKKWRRQQTNMVPDLPETVTRRCEHCLAPYEGIRNTAHPEHPDCPQRRMAA